MLHMVERGRLTAQPAFIVPERTHQPGDAGVATQPTGADRNTAGILAFEVGWGMPGPYSVGAALLAVALGGCIFPARPTPAPHGERVARPVDETRGWSELGQRWLDGRIEGDVIAVRHHGRPVAAVKFHAEHGGVELLDVMLVFADGTSFAPPTRLIFTADTWTRPLQLPDGPRVVNRVEFRYRHLTRGHSVKLALWAR